MNWKIVVLFAGLFIMALAVLDLMNIPVEFPTSSSGANLAIGAGVAASPFLLKFAARKV